MKKRFVPHTLLQKSITATLACLLIGTLPVVAQDTNALTRPETPTIEFLDQVPDDTSTDKQNPSGAAMSITPQNQISHPEDEQPSTPPIPPIGNFFDMPGTNGEVEFTRITERRDGSSNAYVHLYARRSSIDPFNKYVLLKDYLLNLSDFSVYKKVPLGYEYVAAQTEEDTFYGWKGNVFSKWNAATDEITDIYEAPSGKSQYTIGRYEGGMSWDDRYVGLMWNSGSGSQLTVVDTRSGEATGSIHSSSVGDVDWIDMSPTGKYVIVGAERIFRFDTDFSDKKQMDIRGGGSHGDTMYDVAGNEVYVEEGHYSNGQIAYTILDTNERHFTNMVDVSTQSGVKYPNTASHISGQARDLQGLVFVSLQDTSGMFSMFASYLVPGQSEVYHFGHTYTRGDSYASEAKASISNDGKTIVWSSDWMSGGQTYEFLARQK